MSKNRSYHFFIVLLALLLSLSACISPAPESVKQTPTKPLETKTPLPTPTETLAPKSTSKPTTTSVPLPTSTRTIPKVFLSTKANHVALRAGPHINHPEISNLYKKGTQMEILGVYIDWFYVIAPDGNKGWLFEGWLNIAGADTTQISKLTAVPTQPLPEQKRKPKDSGEPTSTYP